MTYDRRDEMFEKGEIAYYNHDDEDKCPYPVGSSDWVWWKDGYYEARDSDIRRQPRYTNP